MSLDSFTEILGFLWPSSKRGGGRAPSFKDQLDDDLEPPSTSYLQPCATTQARLTIVQITDVYTLDNFPSLKTMLQEIRKGQGANDKDNKVVSMVRSVWFLFCAKTQFVSFISLVLQCEPIAHGRLSCALSVEFGGPRGGHDERFEKDAH